jgi:hypothetical protein
MGEIIPPLKSKTSKQIVKFKQEATDSEEQTLFKANVTVKGMGI